MRERYGLQTADAVLILFFFVITWITIASFFGQMNAKLDAICAQVECEVEP